MKLRYFLILTVSLMALTLGPFIQPAAAQTINEPTGLKNVTLWVNPEYDDPRLLVMLEGQISGATLPALIRFLVPHAAEMYSAGSKDTSGKYSPGQNSVGVSGPPDRKISAIFGWDEISYKISTSAATFRMEYYDDIITGSPDKKISYDFRWLYPVSDLQVIIQQPLKATNFTVSPNGIKTVQDGFNVVTITKSNLTYDQSTAQPLHFDIGYTKTDPNPSIQDTSSPAATTTSSNSAALVIIAIALVVVAIFLVLFFLKRKPGPRARLAPRFEPARPVKSRQAGHGEKFCDQCGQPVSKSGKFCANCGNKLG